MPTFLNVAYNYSNEEYYSSLYYNIGIQWCLLLFIFYCVPKSTSTFSSAEEARGSFCYCNQISIHTNI